MLSPYATCLPTEDPPESYCSLLQTVLKMLISKTPSNTGSSSQKLTQQAQEKSILEQLLTCLEKELKLRQISNPDHR